MKENSEIVSSEQNNQLFYLPLSEALLTTPSSEELGITNKGETPVIKELSSGTQHAQWLEGNDDLPQKIIKDVRRNTQLSSGLLWKANTLISGGIVYGTTEINVKTGEETFIPVQDLTIASWNKKNAIHRYLRESALDYFTLWNQYSRMTMNAGKTLIEKIECMNAPFVRLSKQEKTTGKIKNAYISANWADGAKIDSTETLTYPLIDPYYNPLEQAKKLNKLEFIYPIAGPDYDYTYYATPPWNSFRESHWFDVSIAIPQFKKVLLEKQYTIKYHFRLSLKFFLWKFPNWERMNEKEKVIAKADLLKELDEHMAGTTRAGSNLLTIDGIDGSGNPYPGLIITAVDDKLKDGVYIEDSQEAGAHAYSALGIDGTLVSTIPGKGMGAGSGSDKRVAYNIYNANSKPDADLILEPLLFAYEFNGFDQPYLNKGGLKLWFKNYWITTLDQGKEKQQQTK